MHSVYFRSSTGSWRWTRCILRDDGTSHMPHYRVLESKYQNTNYWYITVDLTYFSVNQQPHSGLDRLTVEVSKSHTIRHSWTRYDSSERVISPSQRPLSTQHTTKDRKKIHARDGIRTRDPRNQVAVDRMATGIGNENMWTNFISYLTPPLLTH